MAYDGSSSTQQSVTWMRPWEEPALDVPRGPEEAAGTTIAPEDTAEGLDEEDAAGTAAAAAAAAPALDAVPSVAAAAADSGTRALPGICSSLRSFEPHEPTGPPPRAAVPCRPDDGMQARSSSEAADVGIVEASNWLLPLLPAGAHGVCLSPPPAAHAPQLLWSMLSLLTLLALLVALLALLHPLKPPAWSIDASWLPLPPPLPPPPSTPSPAASTLLPLSLLLLLLLLLPPRPASLLSMPWNERDGRPSRGALYGCDEDAWGLDGPPDRSSAARCALLPPVSDESYARVASPRRTRTLPDERAPGTTAAAHRRSRRRRRWPMRLAGVAGVAAAAADAAGPTGGVDATAEAACGSGDRLATAPPPPPGGTTSPPRASGASSASDGWRRLTNSAPQLLSLCATPPGGSTQPPPLLLLLLLATLLASPATVATAAVAAADHPASSGRRGRACGSCGGRRESGAAATAASYKLNAGGSNSAKEPASKLGSPPP